MDKIPTIESLKLWYEKNHKTGKFKAYSTGLTINGINYCWYELEECYGWSREQYLRRRLANLETTKPKTEQEMLEVPFMGRKRDQAKHVAYGHTQEQLEANKVACSKWV